MNEIYFVMLCLISYKLTQIARDSLQDQFCMFYLYPRSSSQISLKKSQVTFQSSTVLIYWKFTAIAQVLQKSPFSWNRLRHFYFQGSQGTLFLTNKHVRYLTVMVTFEISVFAILFFNSCKAKLLTPSGHKFLAFICSLMVRWPLLIQIFGHLIHARRPKSYLLQFPCGYMELLIL